MIALLVVILMIGAFGGGIFCTLKFIMSDPVLRRLLEYEWTRQKLDQLFRITVQGIQQSVTESQTETEPRRNQ
jgi:hypothetical protein